MLKSRVCAGNTGTLPVGQIFSQNHAKRLWLRCNLLSVFIYLKPFVIFWRCVDYWKSNVNLNFWNLFLAFTLIKDVCCTIIPPQKTISYKRPWQPCPWVYVDFWPQLQPNRWYLHCSFPLLKKYLFLPYSVDMSVYDIRLTPTKKNLQHIWHQSGKICIRVSDIKA